MSDHGYNMSQLADGMTTGRGVAKALPSRASLVISDPSKFAISEIPVSLNLGARKKGSSETRKFEVQNSP